MTYVYMHYTASIVIANSFFGLSTPLMSNNSKMIQDDTMAYQ